MLKLVNALDVDFESVINYCNEFDECWNDLNNYGIQMSQYGIEKYYEYINRKDEYLFYLIDDNNPLYIIGYGSIEDSVILNYHTSYLNVGNIGYGVRPTERNKGYGTTILNLLLEKCEELGMKEVCISCLKENIASRKVIENNKGKLEKEWTDEWSNKKCLKYWVKLHPKLIDRGKRLVKRIGL